tara:strand:+ start:197 stop:598 length:402 start_codon:yes stop_codon:yes gene_type:complete
MSFLRGTRTYLHNIKQDDVCRMFWLGSSPYMPKASGANGSKISTFMKARLRRPTKKMQDNSVKNSANYSTNNKTTNNLEKTAENVAAENVAAENVAAENVANKLRLTVIWGGFGILGFATTVSSWRPGWEFNI